jgi:alpha-glucosidase
MVCDDPTAYEGQDGFDFIKTVPATWDETRVPVAIPGQWAAIARRKNSDWFLGAINSSTTREAAIPLSFLSPGRYEVTMYTDAPDAAIHPNNLIRETRIVQASDSLTASLAAGGGLAVRFKKL